MTSKTKYSEALRYVDIIGETCAILIGENIAIDGFWDRPIRVITHAHYDHLKGLRESILKSKSIIATPPTHELIIALGYIRSKDLLSMYLSKRISLDYHKKYVVNNEVIELYYADHILGAAQVLIETNDYRIGYTGDFRLTSRTEILKNLDVLIIESTYGNPSFRRPFKNDIEELFVDLVLDGLELYRRVIIYGYYGKLQEAMHILRTRGVDEPFIMPRKIFEVTRIAEKYGYRIGNYYLSSTKTAKSIMYSDKHIVFEHFNKARYRRIRDDALYIILSGWEFNEPIKRIDQSSWLVALSDHGDFDELIQYVERSQPEIVVVDGSREGDAHSLTKELRKRGWRAIVLPGSKTVDTSLF